MTPEDVAARFDNRPGYHIATYGLVGLPMFRVTAIGLTLVKKHLDPIEEFVLRCVRIGVVAPSAIAGLLGLPQRIVDGVITTMVRQENLTVDPLGEALVLTERGKGVAEKEEEVRPVNQTLPFTFDAFLRRPRWHGESALLAPRELREQGIPPLRALPNGGPELSELRPRDVGEVVSLAAGRANETLTLLRLTSIEKRIRLYKEAVGLVYRADDTNEVQIAFAIDGRLSEPHERAFAEGDGLSRNDVFDLGSRGAGLAQVKKWLDPELLARIEAPRSRRLRAAVAKARESGVVRSAGVKREIEEQVEQAAQATAPGSVRPLEVYEHAPLLRHAIEEANERLLIISPWIRARVVTPEFIKRLDRLCSRGVAVTIGYGLGKKDQDERPPDARAREALEALNERFANCVVQRLGDTHAKVLIKDRDFYVITSFNWLSFQGERDRTFREELGALVPIIQQVDSFYERCLQRFDVKPRA